MLGKELTSSLGQWRRLHSAHTHSALTVGRSCPGSLQVMWESPHFGVMSSPESRLASNCVCLPVPWFPGPVHRSAQTIGVGQAGTSGRGGLGIRRLGFRFWRWCFLSRELGQIVWEPQFLVCEMSLCGKVPQKWQIFLVSLCVLITIAFSPLGRERKKLCYNPLPAAEYTNNRKINRGVDFNNKLLLINCFSGL